MRICFLIAIIYAVLNLAHLDAEIRFSRFDARGASAVYPLDWRYAFFLAAGNIAAGRLAEALVSLDEVLRLCPKHVDSLNNKGVVLALMNRPDQARLFFSHALKLLPFHPDIEQNLQILDKGLDAKYNVLIIQE